MVDVLAIAKSKREALRKEIRKLDEFIAMGESLALNAESERLGSAAEAWQAAIEDHTRLLERNISRPSPVMTATYEVARKVIESHGAPVPLADLLKAMDEHEVAVGGKERSATLSARLSNSKEFKSHRGLGWWFADRPLPKSYPAASENEAADEQPTQVPSAASSSDASQGGREDAAALDFLT